jgi:hypothetical protein
VYWRFRIAKEAFYCQKAKGEPTALSGHEKTERAETEHCEKTVQVDREGAEKDCEIKKRLRERDWRERGFREKWLIVNGRSKSGPSVNGTTTK